METIYDTHAHLNLSAFKQSYKEITESSLQAGMIINNVGTQKDSSKRAVEMAQEFPNNVFAVVGLHPEHTISKEVDEEDSHFISREEKFDVEYYRALASDPKVVGIGECGIDYYRIPEGMTKQDVRAIQEPVFVEQLKLARELDKGLVVHVRSSKDTSDAYEDILEILETQQKSRGLPRFEIHSFTASVEIAQRFVNLGAFLGLNGIITFDKTGVLKEVVTKIPLEKIVLETDAPYLAPVPYRGKQNLPIYLEHIVKHIAEIKGISFAEVALQTTKNAKELFHIHAI